MRDALSEPKTWLRVGVLSLIIGVFVLRSAFALIGEQNKAAGWPTTKGRIDDVEIVRKSENGYYPRVAYTYGVKGQTYTGSTVWLGDPVVFPTVGQATGAVPAIGIMANVHYDPASPSVSALRTDGDSGLFSSSQGRWGFGLLLFGVLSLAGSFMLNRARQSWLSALP